MAEYITRGLDYYKATMSGLEFANHPDTQVTFELKNRSAAKLSEYVSVDELETRLDELRHGWQPEEIAYLAGLQNQDGMAQFSENYLDFLADNPLPPLHIDHDDQGDIAVRTTGAWPLVTFWETIVMSELNELYFANKLTRSGSSLIDLYAEGDRRLDIKIARLRKRPDIKFSDFGTRRRFSWEWQRHVVTRAAHELPENFIGTSNIYLANELGLPPIGTFAHELPMVYAALEDEAGDNPLDGHNRVLRDWQTHYRGDLSTALTDTFTSDFFFADFTPEQADSWKALRHDSGDPIDFGEKVIKFYTLHNIDPTSKAIVFSDGLDIDMIFRLADHFRDRINIMFGWGTTLTNDLGVPANNFVMKAIRANNTPTVKLSDVAGKHTGPEDSVARYKALVAQRLARGALRELVTA